MFSVFVRVLVLFAILFIFVSLFCFPSNTVISMRLPDSASVFTAEVWVIIKALEQISDSIASKYIVFYRLTFVSPSFTSYEAGTSPYWDGDTNSSKKDIVFCWVPSHTGIKGNEKADSAAKSALDLPRATVGVPNTDFKHLISQYIFSTWQDDWNGAVINKLHSVKPVLGDWQSSYGRCRKDEVVLSCPYRSYTFDTFIYLEERSSTSV